MGWRSWSPAILLTLRTQIPGRVHAAVAATWPNPLICSWQRHTDTQTCLCPFSHVHSCMHTHMCICAEIWTQTFPDSHASTRVCTHMQWLLCDLPPGLSTLRAACTWDGPTTSSSPGLWLVAEEGNSWCWRDEPCRCCQEQAATSSKLQIRLLLRAAQICHPALALPLQIECGSSGLTGA